MADNSGFDQAFFGTLKIIFSDKDTALHDLGVFGIVEGKADFVSGGAHDAVIDQFTRFSELLKVLVRDGQMQAELAALAENFWHVAGEIVLHLVDVEIERAAFARWPLIGARDQVVDQKPSDDL